MKEYPDPSLFLSSARRHMRAWMPSALQGIEPSDPESVLLPPAEASDGKNFYDHQDVRAAIMTRFPRTFRTKATRGSRAGDALCSAHAPFNLFAPLRSQPSGCAARVLSDMIGTNIDEVDAIAFEQPGHRKNPVKDNTAFDSLISARASGMPVRVGVEVKFTEGPYGWGKSEKTRMFDETSLYNVFTVSGGRFRQDAALDLRTCHLKQMWRNMLLAQTLSATLGVPYYYVHLYPKGNEYQDAAVSNFALTLTELGASFFRPITYEKYFEILASAGCDAGWCRYLRRRYIVTGIQG